MAMPNYAPQDPKLPPPDPDPARDPYPDPGPLPHPLPDPSEPGPDVVGPQVDPLPA